MEYDNYHDDFRHGYGVHPVTPVYHGNPTPLPQLHLVSPASPNFPLDNGDPPLLRDERLNNPFFGAKK